MPILTAEERVGTLLAGRYRLESILGSGGTSVVYRASHAWTARSVALKLLKPEHARDRDLVMRFLREARTASTLVHPSVVAILDMGTDPEGDVYLAMELLTGESLGAVLDREGALEVPRAAELLRPIMDAIASAHARGIVHRDVKPDNVMIGDRGDGVTRSILLDFGMAKTTEAAWGHATQTGTIVGTPFYMSPEQAEGASDVGPASDVWSMGVLWYRCLSGALPFFGSVPTSLLLAIVRGDHPPLRERAPHVPEAVASVIERALRVDRGERYADMKAMLAALDGALAGRVDAIGAAPAPRTAELAKTVAPPYSHAGRSSPELQPPEVDRTPTRRARRAALAVAALVMLGAIAGGTMLLGEDTGPLAATPAATTPPATTSIGTTSIGTGSIGTEPIASEIDSSAVPALAAEAEEAPPAPAPRPIVAPAVRAASAPERSVPAIASPPETEPSAPSRARRSGLARSIDDREERPSSGLAAEW